MRDALMLVFAAITGAVVVLIAWLAWGNWRDGEELRAIARRNRHREWLKRDLSRRLIKNTDVPVCSPTVTRAWIKHWNK